jgi:tetratricopeptide (TPR) repeat protein
LFFGASSLAITAWAQPGGISTGGNSQRPINFHGRVALADGRALPEKARIELVCQAQHQFQGRTDLKGGFNIQLGLDRYQGASDASISSPAAGTGFGGQLSTGRTINQVDGMSIVALIGCNLEASLPGYRSDIYDVSRVRVGDVNTDVGTLFLHELTRSPETVVSATSMAVPKDARRALDKAREEIANSQPAEAEKELGIAVQAYPKYAEAWQELGSLLQSRNKNADARRAYLKSKEADPKFPKPYLSLARLSTTEHKWQDALDNSAALLNLSPSDYPEGYYYHAAACYNLGDYDKAFTSAQQAVRLDAVHATPLAEELLGLLYSKKGDYKSAAEQYRRYLEHVPAATNVDAVKALLAEAETRAARNARN